MGNNRAYLLIALACGFGLLGYSLLGTSDKKIVPPPPQSQPVSPRPAASLPARTKPQPPHAPPIAIKAAPVVAPIPPIQVAIKPELQAIVVPSSAPVRTPAPFAVGQGFEWVTIPGGSFTMGAADLGANSRPHQVAVRAFQMAKTLVTKAQYQACINAGICTAPTCLWPAEAGEENLPVVCVTWDEARQFSQWAGGRLPSEAEWEYAARSAGKDWKYPWGNEDATCEKAVTLGCARRAAPVCSKPAGNTQQGLCDMMGDAWEWVQDWYHASYDAAPTDGSAWESPAASDRVIRGGSWKFDAGFARSANRFVLGPGNRRDALGFRPAREFRRGD